MEYVYFLAIGALAGWLAGLLVKGRGFGLIGNVVVGVLGAVLGGYLSRQMGVGNQDDLLGVLLTAFAGSALLLVIVGVLKKA
ncbi:Transglycosylase associated protein [Planctomycetes bacterium Pla163]|uniref:Transglycosylase associated protein n=1 Tax=Rohdeia mirabilis TaxID=2528008 RepID=A0A518CZL3_9BACT|nr:Transglycosylase associated protein [Planctomycetes bacterium Pla163]